ncbi:MAG: 3-dehydroquinate synthase [Clostridium sp.]|nr:3-dehydroquinate synthase [Clostridium sp.]
MKTLFSLKVNIPEKKAYDYDILIGENLLDDFENIVKRYTKAEKFLIVTNDKIFELYKEKMKLSGSEIVVLPDGEEYKNFDNLKKILDAAVKFRLERKDCIIAFGGGVIGDMAGFAAASYMRGIDFVQVPTTLLSMVDSSVGGKVAINHEHGKNLIGAFYQPKVVIADISTLKTLDNRQLKTGLGEVLKYAFIEKSCGADLNYRFYDFLCANKDKIYKLDVGVISELVNICCDLKAVVVNQDETEKGLRAILNLGHTFAHSIENLTNYRLYTHGEAVAIGMKMAFKLSFIKKLIDKNYYDSAIKLIESYELAPELCALDREKFYDEMFLDKKAQNGKVRFVLPNGLYNVEINSDVTKEQIFDCLN